MDKDGWRDGGTDSSASSKRDLPAEKGGLKRLMNYFLSANGKREEAEGGGSSELEGLGKEGWYLCASLHSNVQGHPGEDTSGEL